MKNSSIYLLSALALFIATPAEFAFAQQRNTEHTFKLDGSTLPAASIEDVAWLSGNWQGTAFGSDFEEVWNPPSAGTMVGMYKVFDPQKGVSFYELMLIVEEKQGLILKVKHFAPDFSGWEEKDSFVSFPLIRADENEIHFAGLSFYKANDNEMTAYIAIGQKDGEPAEEKLTYARRNN